MLSRRERYILTYAFVLMLAGWGVIYNHLNVTTENYNNTKQIEILQQQVNESPPREIQLLLKERRIPTQIDGLVDPETRLVEEYERVQNLRRDLIVSLTSKIEKDIIYLTLTKLLLLFLLSYAGIKFIGARIK